MKRIHLSILAVGLALFLVGGALAKDQDAGNWRERQRQRMELLRTWRMMEALDLDKETSQNIFEIRRRFLKERKELRSEIRTKFRRIRELLNIPPEKVDEGELKSLLDDVRQSRKRMRSLWEKQYDEVSKVLTVRQQAQLMVFLKDFRREVRMLRRMGPPGGRRHLRGQPGGTGRNRPGFGPPRHRGFHRERPGGGPRGGRRPAGSGPKEFNRGQGRFGPPGGPPPGGRPSGPPREGTPQDM